MALKFRGKEAVEFGSLAVFPQETPELKLRIRNVNLTTDTNIQEAIEVMSSFFPTHKEEVKSFMQEQMKDFELGQLQAYLVGGSSAVDIVGRSLDRDIDRRMDEANKARESANG